MFHVFLEKQYMYEPTLIFLIFIKSGRVQREFEQYFQLDFVLFTQVKSQVVFALAHNTIVRWDNNNDHIMDIVQCEENSILYPYS